MTRQPSTEQVRRRRERDRVNHARARARAAGRDPAEIPSPEPTLRRVVLPVSRAPQTGWQDRAACRTSPPEWFDAESDEDAARALAVCAGCEVREECFLAAAADRAESGVWGGVDLSAADRAAGPSSRTGSRERTGGRMNNDHWPVPYTLTPAAEALLEAEAGDMTAPWEWQGRSAGTAEIHLTEEAERQSDAEAWGGRGPSASYAEWPAEGQPEAGS